MPKPSKPSVPKVRSEKNAKTIEVETKVLPKSDYPKTPGATIKMVLNLF